MLFKKYLLESGVDNDHIIEIALDGIENEELRETPSFLLHEIPALQPQSYFALHFPLP